MKNLQKRKTLIRKLFKEVAKETIGKVKVPPKLRIIDKREYSTCRTFFDGEIVILLGLSGVNARVRSGYPADYYKGRPDRLNKYIIKNRHNALRFILYHELRHAWQRLNDINRDNEYQREYDADSWALAHIKTRPETKVVEYIDLYNAGVSTAKIALLCKVKDPRSIRYYLTKAGINLRRS